jgi:RNA polymerase sigma-70 factor, ECF subfamily
MHPLTDEALMVEIGRGNAGAFAELYDRYGERMHRFFSRMLAGDTAKAEDLTQDLFLTIIEKPHLFDAKRKFSTWIYAIATNRCRNVYRKKQTVSFDAFDTTFDRPVLGNTSQYFDETDKERFDFELNQAIEQLDEMHRRCFILRFQEALSVHDIAEIENCPAGTVKSRIHNALKKVQSKLTHWTNLTLL